MLKSSLCDYSDASILVIGIIILVEAGADAATITADRNNKHVIFKNCTLLTDCITVINNTQVDNAKDLDIIMSMYNLTEYSDNYSKTSGNYGHIAKMCQMILQKNLNHLNLNRYFTMQVL